MGYVHAVAHTLGGFYQVPHGLANAVILPYFLEHYGPAVHPRLAELADVAGVGGAGGSAERSEAFIEAIRAMNRQMGIPETIAGIRDEDVPRMIRRALEEGNPLYPVPKIFTERDMLTVYQRIRG